MNAAALKTTLLRAHAKAPQAVGFGIPTVSAEGSRKKEYELDKFQYAVESDNNPALDELDLKGIVAPKGLPSQLLEFSGTSENGYLYGHTDNGTRVGQRIFTPESIEKMFVLEDADGLEVRLTHIDRQTPENTTEEKYSLRPTESGDWELQVPLTGYGDELKLGDMPKPGSSCLGDDARIVKKDNTWHLVGDAPF
jgi:hypothetical protein